MNEDRPEEEVTEEVKWYPVRCPGCGTRITDLSANSGCNTHCRCKTRFVAFVKADGAVEYRAVVQPAKPMLKKGPGNRPLFVTRRGLTG